MRRALEWWDGRLADMPDVSFDDLLAVQDAPEQAPLLSNGALRSRAGTGQHVHSAQCGGIGARLALLGMLLLGGLLARWVRR